jgi:hypothetical protein
MIPASSALQTMLTTRNVYLVADLYEIGALRITTWPAGLAPFVASGYVVKSTAYRTVAAMEDPTFRITLAVGAEHASVLSSAASGAFEGLPFKAERAYMEPPGGSVTDLVLTRFAGTIVQALPSSSEVTFVASSALGSIKSRRIGRLIEATCPWTFKDAACGYTGAQTDCDKSVARCVALQNITNFGGFPYAPKPRITGPSL